MAKTDLSAEELRQMMSYDPDSGVFTWLVQRGGINVGDVAGALCIDGYISITIRKELYRAHRLAVLFVLGRHPAKGIEVDHINGIRGDNRWSNLREVTPSQNQHNRSKPPKSSTTGLMGASRPNKEGRYRACIRVHGKTIHLGTHDTAELAHAAYKAAKARLHHPTPEHG